jgi:hypothetical protein
MKFEGHKHSEKSKQQTRKSMQKWWRDNRETKKVLERNRKIGESRRGNKISKQQNKVLQEGHRNYIRRFRRQFYKKEPIEYEEERKQHFAKYGWKCVCLWEEDLKNEKRLLDEKLGNL